ncbi:unnamed protein product, partial [Allacma fusca]
IEIPVTFITLHAQGRHSFDFADANIQTLRDSTTLDTHLLELLVKAEAITDEEKDSINASNLDVEKADSFYTLVGKKLQKLPKVLKVFKGTGNNHAKMILENFSDPSGSALRKPEDPGHNIKTTSTEIQTDENLMLAPATSVGSTESPEWIEKIRKAVVTAQQDYRTDAKHKGTALIVNVINFENNPKEKRWGAEKDSDQLVEVLQQRNFLVYTLTDPTYKILQRHIWQFQNCSFENESSFLLAVMSHGYGKCIDTKDNKKYDVWNGIVEQFNNSNCPGLLGKPKIFIFNFCRGESEDDGIGSTQHDSFHSDPFKLPSWSDMLVCYSTMDGFRSLRNTTKGSWYIQTLCEILRQEGDIDINTLLNAVAVVMKTLETTGENPGKKQICQYYNIGFTKKFYF